MTAGTTRRPLPALICLLALTLLTALVWWRVLNRSDAHTVAAPTCTPQITAVVLPLPAAVSLTVLNATTRNGIAKSTAATLAKDGFKIDTYTNDAANTKIAGVAEIRATPDEQRGAALLGYYFPGAKQVQLSSTVDSTLVVSLGNTFTTVATPAAVKAALDAAHVTQSTSAPTTSNSPTC